MNGVKATIPVLVISGSKLEMGIQYGKIFKDYMLGALQILKEFYVHKMKIPHVRLVNESKSLPDL